MKGNVARDSIKLRIFLVSMGTVGIASIPTMTCLDNVSILYVILMSVLSVGVITAVIQMTEYYKKKLPIICLAVIVAVLGLIFFKEIASGMQNIYEHFAFDVYIHSDMVLPGAAIHYNYLSNEGIFIAYTFIIMLVALILTLQERYFRNAFTTIICVTIIPAIFISLLIIPHTFSLILCVLYVFGLTTIRKDSEDTTGCKAITIIGIITSIIILILIPENGFSKPEWFNQVYVATSDVLNGETIVKSSSKAVGGLNKGELGRVDRVEYTNSIVGKLTTVSTGKSQYIKMFTGLEYKENAWTEDSDSNNKSENNYIQYTYNYLDANPIYRSVAKEKTLNSFYNLNYYDTYMKYWYTFSDGSNTTKKLAFYADIALGDYQVFEDMNIQQPMAAYYENYVYENYTDIPDDVSDVIDSLIGEWNITNAEEKADYISYVQNFLSTNYTYTLKPGAVPGNKDFVTYFLTEKKEGYCSYFATAATLMFRNAGIPAVYCEGYVVENSDILRGVKGTEKVIRYETNFEQVTKTLDTYSINVTDNEAHAWVEVFMDGYGWINVEVTPGYDTSFMNNKSNLDNLNSNKENETTAESSTSAATEASTEDQTSATAGTSENGTDNVNDSSVDANVGRDGKSLNGNAIGNSIDMKMLLKLLAAFVIIIAAAVAVYILIIEKIRHRNDVLDGKAGAIAIYIYMEKLLKAAGYVRDESMDYETFAKEVTVKDEYLKTAGVTEITSLMLKCEFAEEYVASEHEMTMVTGSIKNIRQYILAGIKPVRRYALIIFRGM